MQLPNLVLPPWLNIKFIALWLFGLTFFALAWSWNNRGHQVDTLTNFQTAVTQAVSDAQEPNDKGIRPRLKPEQVVTAITGLRNSYTSAKTTIQTISAKTIEDKKRADANDAALNKQLASLKTTYSLANKRIEYLETRPPIVGDDATQCRVIKDDTNSAWDGWK